MLALRRYAEATRHYWATTIKMVKTQTVKTLGPLATFQRNDLRSYKDCRRNYDAAQSKYDSILQAYASNSKNKEASALREDAFQLSEVRKAYVKACFDLSCIVAVVERHVNVVLVDTLVDPWILRSKSLVAGDPTYFPMGVDMYRIKSWSKALSACLKPIEAEMLRLRQEMEEQTITRSIPSRDLNDYMPQNSTLSHFVPNLSPSAYASNEKHGWLFVKTSARTGRHVWIRRWAFVKGGIFGWLVLSPSKTFVQETDKIGVLLCNVSPEPNEDRRFCFEIRTKDSTLVLQADSLAELKSWLQVFEVSKREAIEKMKTGDASTAFQLMHPLIPEFASGSSPYNDEETVGLKSNNGPNAPSRKSTDASFRPGTPSTGQQQPMSGYFSGVDANKLQTMMNAGKSMILSSLLDPGQGQFSTLGTSEAPLAPLPVINTPMPTSMTKEAIIANSFLHPTTVPSAFTANYWGSVNWASYQIAHTSTSSLSDSSKSSDSTAVQTPASSIELVEPYPAFYPLELRSQDIQMRAIFQGLADPDKNDRVVMVFRALFRPNPKQELPGRAFVTTKFIYMYSCSFGFTILEKKPISRMVSIEGSSSTGWDSLYLLTEKGESLSCRVFIDAGRLIKRRVQYLIDNISAEEPDGLEQVITKLRKLGTERQKKIQKALDDIKNHRVSLSSDDDDDMMTDDDDYDEDYGATSKRLLQRYLSLQNSLKPKSTASKTDEVNATFISSKQHPNIESNLATLMDRLMLEQIYDVPAKALFHVMFGELSPVFKYTDSPLYNRTKLEVSPWHKTTSSRLEREITYFFNSKGILTGSQGSSNERTTNLQRIERKDDNLVYIVYDRRTPWELPYGATFYVTTRFVIQATRISQCKLSIWSNIEWIKSAGIARNVVESLVYNHFIQEAKNINERVAECRKRLGHRGMTNTAVRLFGKLGTSVQDETRSSNSEYSGVAGRQEQRDTNQTPISVTKEYLIKASAGVLGGWVVSIISNVFMVLGGIGRRVWHEISLRKFLILFLLISIGCNVFLSARSTVAYWTESRAYHLSKDLNLIPSSNTAMRRTIYLGEISQIINDGRGFARGEEPSMCHDKFRSIAYYEPIDGADLDKLDFTVADLDSPNFELSARLNRIRNDIGEKRNDLLVNLRLLNRIEAESLFAEWRSWLLSELKTCKLATRYTTNISSDLRSHLDAYCDSCLQEWESSVSTQGVAKEFL
ncbi:Sip3p [Sugiyamaella lignohabitans]|uniref:Sip3p n=1 Tax=Sugiyamaella lignohabitans TaxID=796027 RepID=A0A167FJE6_9ASCO|nr:Sip3p [Sugiyamaella lignohabitans]ANB15378.1 Sip3p [Sugiyamaella lignohabitans]